MKLDFAIALCAALGFHAGALWLVPGADHESPAATEIEVGLESGQGVAGEPVPEELAAPPLPVPQPVTEKAFTPVQPETSPANVVEDAATVKPGPPLEHPPPSKSSATLMEQPLAAPAASPATAPVKKPAAKATTKASSVSSHSRGVSPGSSVTTARYRFRAPLRYPASALRQHAGGLAILGIELDAAGRVARITVRQSTGHADLDAAAVECARRSRYEPYRVNGIAQPCRVDAPFRFEAQ